MDICSRAIDLRNSIVLMDVLDKTIEKKLEVMDFFACFTDVYLYIFIIIFILSYWTHFPLNMNANNFYYNDKKCR